MMRRSPPLFRPTRHEESSGHPPSTPIAAFRAWLDVHGHDAGALFGRAVRGRRGGERRFADEQVAVILRDRAAATGIAPFIPGCSTPAPTWLATTVAEMRPSAKPPISCMCRSSRGRRTKLAATKSILDTARQRLQALLAVQRKIRKVDPTASVGVINISRWSVYG